MRLSSITNFPPTSQPELFSQSQLRQVADSTPGYPFSNHSLRRTESVPTQNFSSNLLPFTTISQPHVELNPYSHFASDRVSAASPHSGPHSRSAPVWALNGAKTNDDSFPRPFSLDTASERSNLALDLHPNPHSGNEDTSSSLLVEQLDADSLSKASDFRHFMPQARRLPFKKAKAGESKAKAKATAKRKPHSDAEVGIQVEKTTDVGSAIKKKRITNKKAAIDQTTAKSQTQRAQRSKSRATGGRKAEPGKGAAAVIKATQQISSAKQVSKSSAPRTRASAKILPPEKTADEQHVEKRLPEQAGVAAQGTTRRSQVKKQATKATPSNRLLEPSKTRKPPKMRSPIHNIASTASIIDEPSARSDSTTLHLQSQVEKVTPQMILETPESVKNSSSNDLQLEKAESNATLLISESTVLDALNQKTWKIIDQYETDLDCGLNRFDIAQYYVDSLHNARFEFWHDRLAELGSENPLHIRQPVS